MIRLFYKGIQMGRVRSIKCVYDTGSHNYGRVQRGRAPVLTHPCMILYVAVPALARSVRPKPDIGSRSALNA